MDATSLIDIEAAIPASLQVRAKKLGARIVPLGREPDDDDVGPFRLIDDDSGFYEIWCTGLPLAGIADALDCLEREHQGDEHAWRDFGANAEWFPPAA